MSPHASLEGKVIKEVWTSNSIDLDNLKILGCPIYAHISSEDRPKFDPKSNKCVCVDYANGVNGFKLWNPIKKDSN